MIPERLTLCAECPAGQKLFAGIATDQTTAVLFCAAGEGICSVEAEGITHTTVTDQAPSGELVSATETQAVVYGWCGRMHDRLGGSFIQQHRQITPTGEGYESNPNLRSRSDTHLP